MSIAAAAQDILWRPRGLCPSQHDWLSRDPLEPERQLAASHRKIEPAPGMECHVTEFLRGKVVGDAKLACSSSNVVVEDVQFLYGAASPQAHFVLKQRRLRRPRSLAGTAMLLAGSNAENYYHWLFDSLPRLALVERSGIGLGAIDWFLVDASANAFQVESLRMLGIPETKLKRCAKREVLTCERLVLPSMPGPLGFPPRWVCDFLRQSFWPKPPEPASRKIYLSRRHARGRRVLNEPELAGALAENGFETILTDHMGFAEQVALFMASKVVVTPHGAGLSNIVFCQPGRRCSKWGRGCTTTTRSRPSPSIPT